MTIETAISELRRLHSDLAAEIDRHCADNPNDERGIAIMAARRNGVGKAIEIVERNSKDPTKCGRCGGTGQLEYEITFHGERNQRVKDDCRYCKGTGLAA